MDACFSCFSSSRTEEDREPLLPRHTPVQFLQSAASHQPPPPDEPLSKVVDVLAALSAGKLPSQTQINTFLRRVLHSNVLQESQHAQDSTTQHGHGPLSKHGRKVIEDLGEVIEALLQFGMEKNDDDLIQNLFSQMWKIEKDESPIPFMAMQDAPEQMRMRKQAGKEKDDTQHQIPHRSEVYEDSKTMVKAIQTLLTTFFTSSVFRLILSDTIAIGRELVAHAASDISTATLNVHNFAEEVEHKAADDDFGRSVEQQETSDLKEMVKTAVEEGKAAASDTAQDIQKSLKEKSEKWEDHVSEAEEEVKRNFLVRIQEMITRAQEDPSSRSAVIAILHIVRKYAHRFTSASRQVIDCVRESASGPSSQRDKDDPGTQDGVPIGFADPSSYPPQPYCPPRSMLIPGIKIDSPHLQNVLQDTKMIVERIARGHKIDNMIKTFGNIIKHSVAPPQDLGRNIEKLSQEKSGYGDGGSSSSGATLHAEHVQRSLDEFEQFSGVSTDNNGQERMSLLALYFSSFGHYFDNAMNRPGWVTSEAGQKSLEALYDATQELLCMAGEAMADAEDIAQETGRAKKLDETNDVKAGLHRHEDNSGMEESWLETGRSNSSTEEKEKEKEDMHSVTDDWVKDIITFFWQMGDYVDAMERDRTTMKLAHALETLREDFGDLFGAGKQEVGEAARKFKTEVQQEDRSTARLGLYTQWLGWALPCLLRLLPLYAIPLPRVEVKTDGVECAIDPLWVRGLAFKKKKIGGRYGVAGDSEDSTPRASLRDQTTTRGPAVKGGIYGQLIPDEVLFRQWTEVKVRLLNTATSSRSGARDRLGARSRRNEVVPDIQATSRVRVRMDGIKACVHDMGYYFKYNGTIFNYEDEGILSVDLGTIQDGGKQPGFGLDVELEIDSSDIEMNKHTGNEGIPIVVVEDVDHPEHPNRVSEHPQLGLIDVIPVPPRLSIDIALANVTPLFRVLNVRVGMRGLKFKFDQSRHWLFNKLLVEPFGTSFISTAAKHVLENSARKALEAISAGMALIITEAKGRASSRRVKQFSEKRNGNPDAQEEDGKVKISDIYTSLIERGPEIFAYYTQNPDVRETETHTELTRRGVVTHIQHEPNASKSMVIPSLYDERSMREQEGESLNEAEQTEEVTVAVGTGAQLFPGKGGPYGVPKSTRDVGKDALREVREGVKELGEVVQKGHQRVKKNIEVGQETVKGKETRFVERRDREREGAVNDWRSPAFDF